MGDLIYSGSVKNIYRVSDFSARPKPFLSFVFTDQYSVFDWGAMPDLIPEKGRSLAAWSYWFFKRMEDPKEWQKRLGGEILNQLSQNTLNQLRSRGMPTHFLGSLNASERDLLEFDSDLQFKEFLFSNEHPKLAVEELRVIPPKIFHVNDNLLYDYSEHFQYPENRVLPLEVIFRFGLPEGSSMLKRLKNNPDLAQQLGLSGDIKAGTWFPKPVIEFTSKLESKDRLLGMDQAFSMSGLNGKKFQELYELAQANAHFLKTVFDDMGIELWDGKFEFGINRKGEIILVDSIGPDELRLKKDGVHLSKEALRQGYEGSDWLGKVNQAKKSAKERGIEDWKKLAIKEFSAEPENQEASHVEKVSQMYQALSNSLYSEQIFDQAWPLSKVIEAMK